MSIQYISEYSSLEKSGFFVGWPNPPSEETLNKILKGSYRIVLALEDKKSLDL